MVDALACFALDVRKDSVGVVWKHKKLMINSGVASFQ